MHGAVAESGAAAPAGGDSRRDVLRWGLVTVAGVIAGYAAVLLANARHYFTDDTESQYTALWVGLGRALREGTFPVMVPEQWMAGNNTMDDAGLYNPPQLLIDLIAPSIDNVAVYATVVKLIFSIIAALGVYRICLVYGARPAWSAVAGVAFPLSGFFLFFDQASWMTALTGTAWMVHAWASSVRYTRGLAGPIPVFVFLYLTISTQYIFPAVEAVLMLAAVAVAELVRQRRWQPVLRLTLVSACAGLAGLLTFLPSILSAKVTWRGTSQIINDQFLTVPWSESLNASLPSAMPAFTSWWGYVQPIPMTYIAWFVIPALAFVDWRRAGRGWREYLAVALFAGMMLMWTAGPGTIGPLRWPARVLPMLAIGLLVLVCVLLGRYGTLRDRRGRFVAAGLLILALFVRTFSADPHDVGWHVLSALAVAALGVAVVRLAGTRGVAAACALTIVAMFPIAYLQVRDAQPTPMAWNLPADRGEAKAAFPDFEGTTLQLGERGLLQPQDRSLDGAYGSLVFGNYARALERDYVNGYTPTGYFYFGELLCMRWDSSVCPDAYRRVFAPEPSTGRPLVDLMKVDRVVLQRALFPDVPNQPAPDGWKWVDQPGHERYIAVLERIDGPVSTVNGRIAHTRNATATSIDETDTTSRVRVSAEQGGQVVFARLGWPGYRATLNGTPVPITTVAKSFVAVDLPPGTTDAELVLTWRPPGWKIGIAAMAAGLVGLGLMQWWYVRSTRRPAGDDPEPGVLERVPVDVRA
ncbi:Predicted membrane protein [Nocardia farcinica]|uniref:Predicted membrane protein n=1 Tax=Nocardia farcinica TaxID=37329 RepID=A0A449HBF2_NOCFR|nr:Predicted membrane protein [Nocardia farcinica]